MVLNMQKEEAASRQHELDRVQRAYEKLKAQERQLEDSLSYISEEVKGVPSSKPPFLSRELCGPVPHSNY